jgi:SAM-dependent methyltransferase
MDGHLQAIARVYGPETWELYELLDRSLDPRGPATMLALAAEHLSPASVVLDVGCRDAAHLIELVRDTGARGVGVDPVPRLVAQARAAVAAAGLDARVEILEGTMQALPHADGEFDLVWCRDVLEVVEPLDVAVAEAARVLRPGGRLVVYTVLATDRLEPKEAELLAQSLAVVPASLAEASLEAAFARAGLTIELADTIGTEWREWLEERTHPVATDLLGLARLRRQRARIVAEVGPELYGHVEANLHWGVYQLLGKLLPRVYVLEKA